MKKRILYILLAIIAVSCMSLSPDNEYQTSYIDIVRVKNKKLLYILNSILVYEKKCDYYKPGLRFNILSRMINDSIYEFSIGAFDSSLIEGGEEHYKGYFRHGGHDFFVQGEELNESVFTKTRRKKEFVFYPAWETMSDGRLLLRLISDHTYSGWTYHYINGKFFLDSMDEGFCHGDAWAREILRSRQQYQEYLRQKHGLE
jgi:hypothetical protein